MAEPSKPNGPAPEQPGTQVLPEKKTDTSERNQHAPLYHVILHNDDLHSYHYVIVMLMQLFGMSAEKAYEHAVEVDTREVTIVATTTLERAELKRDQIRAFGPDPLIPKSPGSMSASIEPVPQG
ncbi:MAG: ATP-dependent Clp protease adaptor ClpS [Planctomycetota bacterium]|nr:ATP-dependent Clp protease adaptor ClpS [Planctomycetota bacterium]